MADTTTISIEVRQTGQRRPLIPTRPFTRAPSDTVGTASTTLRLRDLIAAIVRDEAGAFHHRQDERRLVQVLTARQIADSAQTGKIDMGGARDVGTSQPPVVDEESAVAAALQAFADGLFFVFLDGKQYDDLDAAIEPREGSTLLFVRLVALAGG